MPASSAGSRRDEANAASVLVACLPHHLLCRLRGALDGTTVLSCATIAAGLAAAAERPADAIVIDPALPDGASGCVDGAFDARERLAPIVLYTQSTPAAVRRCFAWARAGASHLLLAGVDDDTAQLRSTFHILHRRRAVEGLVQHLSGHLATVPPQLAGALRQLLADPDAVVTLDALAGRARMTRRSLNRWLKRAGLAPPKRILAAARLVQAHTALVAERTSVARAAERAGFASERSLALHARDLLGAPPSVLRTLGSAELSERVARRLRTAAPCVERS